MRCVGCFKVMRGTCTPPHQRVGEHRDLQRDGPVGALQSEVARELVGQQEHCSVVQHTESWRVYFLIFPATRREMDAVKLRSKVIPEISAWQSAHRRELPCLRTRVHVEARG